MQTHCPVILFDGQCNLCHFCVRFIVHFDKQITFKLCPMQSDKGERLLMAHKVKDPLSSMLVIDKNQLYKQSDAVLFIATQLGFPFSLANVFKLLPKGFRDRIYDWLGRNRYRFFGKQTQCKLLTEEQKQHFL
ncbi:thiol-disulfide oxidoreductase DCC family protein [Pseudoalteromonas sp. Cn5-37]|uniref:thiol-disulfide oxidoreductase DCC family protein n=1 Tax=Pseudoalteromonas sp. Cn5-37 TaxID=2908886 RepID=UPI002E1EAB20